MTRHPRIVSDPVTLAGKPRIAGTRIAVELILDRLAQGSTIEELLADYPQLQRADVLAALAFAADWLRMEEVELAPPEAA